MIAEVHHLHGSKLKFMPTGMVKGFREQEVRKQRASLEEEVEELMPGADASQRRPNLWILKLNKALFALANEAA